MPGWNLPSDRSPRGGERRGRNGRGARHRAAGRAYLPVGAALFCIGVVAATAVMEAVGGGAPTGGSISAVLIGLAVLLLVAGVVTAFTAGIRGAAAAGAGRAT